MSKFLSQITKGKKSEPLYGIVYGVEGVGKTTFGAQLPDVVFMGPETSKKFDVSRLPKPSSFSEGLEQLRELAVGDHSFRSVCVDSLDWIEHSLHDEMRKKEGKAAVEDCGGGYGKWVGVANKNWLDMIGVLQEIREKREMNILNLAHFHVKQFNDPLTAVPYDRYMMKMNDKAAALWREAVDFVFFANFKTSVKITDSNAKKGKGISDGRVLYTEKRASHDAKNRFGLPSELPFDFHSVYLQVNQSEADQLKVMQAEVEALILDITDKELLVKAKETFEKTKMNLDGLRLVKNRLSIALGNQA